MTIFYLFVARFCLRHVSRRTVSVRFITFFLLIDTVGGRHVMCLRGVTGYKPLAPESDSFLTIVNVLHLLIMGLHDKWMTKRNQRRRLFSSELLYFKLYDDILNNLYDWSERVCFLCCCLKFSFFWWFVELFKMFCLWRTNKVFSIRLILWKTYFLYCFNISVSCTQLLDVWLSGTRHFSTKFDKNNSFRSCIICLYKRFF